MRRSRITYEEAFQHVMARGYQGMNIFESDSDKNKFLEFLVKFSQRRNISIVAWCILDNHVHLVIYDCSSKLSNFMKELNGSYGIYYRKKYGGKGSVFDGRFKSSLIEDENYLLNAITYLYLNPVRSGLIKNPEKYKYSSFHELLNENNHSISDLNLIESIYNSITDFKEQIMIKFGTITELSIKKDRWGESLGSSVNRFHSLKTYNRRNNNKNKTYKNEKRINAKKNKKSGEIVEEFLLKKNINMSEITERTIKASRLRGELIIILRDIYGFSFNEINILIPFVNIKYASLGKLYSNAMKRLK